ncbi:MAG TPA: hypothetical protein VK929_01140 [Longimicrobiales bacterium]|nr:hypothetical protein [Longimicrobiales bacterium]
MGNDEGRARPRAFYPEWAQSYQGPGTTPGWDLNGPERRMDDGRTLARAMGWVSFGLGAVELAAPKHVARFLGVDERHAPLIRAYGAREVASGAGIMSQRTPTAGVWSRVAGDALDLATLAVAMMPSRRRDRVLLAMGVVGGALALDALAAKQLGHEHIADDDDRNRRRRPASDRGPATYHDVRRAARSRRVGRSGSGAGLGYVGSAGHDEGMDTGVDGVDYEGGPR